MMVRSNYTFDSSPKLLYYPENERKKRLEWKTDTLCCKRGLLFQIPPTPLEVQTTELTFTSLVGSKCNVLKRVYNLNYNGDKELMITEQQFFRVSYQTTINFRVYILSTLANSKSNNT